MDAREGRGGGWTGKVSEEEWEIKVTSCEIESHRNKRHSIRNTVNNFLTAMHGDRWQLYL